MRALTIKIGLFLQLIFGAKCSFNLANVYAMVWISNPAPIKLECSRNELKVIGN